MKRYKIYCLIDPSNSKIRYIGCTQNIQKRLNKHKRDTVNPEKVQWIKEIKEKGYSGPLLEVIESYDNKEYARMREKQIIKDLKNVGVKLLNYHNFRHLSNITKQRMSVSTYRYWRNKK